MWLSELSALQSASPRKEQVKSGELKFRDLDQREQHPNSSHIYRQNRQTVRRAIQKKARMPGSGWERLAFGGTGIRNAAFKAKNAKSNSGIAVFG